MICVVRRMDVVIFFKINEVFFFLAMKINEVIVDSLLVIHINIVQSTSSNEVELVVNSSHPNCQIVDMDIIHAHFYLELKL